MGRKKKKSPNSFAHAEPLDEELILAHRCGDPLALNYLLQRYIKSRHRHVWLVSPQSGANINDWDLNDATFRAFLQSVEAYEFIGVRFVTFYLRTFLHECCLASNQKLREQSNVSLDQLIDDDGEQSVVHPLSDFVPTTSITDLPPEMVNYAEMIENLEEVPKQFPPKTNDIIRDLSDGYTVEETGQRHDMTPNQVRYILRRYRKWARTVLERIYQNSPETYAESKKLLDQSLACADDGDEE